MRRARLAHVLVFLATLAACGQSDQPPIAHDSSAILDEDTSVSEHLIAEDPEGAALNYILTAPPTHGEVAIDYATGQFTYRPSPNFNGIDSFHFQVSDGALRSAPATVSLKVSPINDPPVAATLDTLRNSAYSLETVIPLPITDIDGDTLSVSVTSSDSQIATVSTDGSTVTITPIGYGTTRLHVAANDGQYSAETDFDFTVADVTKNVVVSPAEGEPSVISLTNDANIPATFTLTYNGNEAFTSAAAAAEHVRNMAPEYPGETFQRRLWRYVRDNTYHNVPITNDHMWYDMWTTLNSLGWGFCGHVAAVYVEIARAAGYDARVWGLSGHVVPEIYVDGHWEMYDPDLAVYYYTRNGNVAGVEELAQDPTLITSPKDPVLPTFSATNSGPYRFLVADIYSTASDNYIDTHNFRTMEPSGSTKITLPVGSRLSLAGRWTSNPVGYDGDIPYEVSEYRQASLRLPPGWTGSMPMPWVLWAVQGQGSIRIGEKAYSVGDPALDSYLRAPGTPVKSVEVASNTEGMRLVFLINATWYDVLPRNEVGIHGRDVWAVTVAARPVAEDIATGGFPESLRKPTDTASQ